MPSPCCCRSLPASQAMTQSAFAKMLPIVRP
jgi:hypothetical protein